MSNVERFEELLRSDEGLQAKLRAATDAYEGDRSDERAVFDAVVAPLAAEAGLPFAFEEAKAAAEDGATLSDAELDAVAGGGCFIFGLGGGSDGANACSDKSSGAGACAGVGVGFLSWS